MFLQVHLGRICFQNIFLNVLTPMSVTYFLQFEYNCGTSCYNTITYFRRYKISVFQICMPSKKLTFRFYGNFSKKY